MITLNLLPDIKHASVEAKRYRDRFVVWSAVVAGSFLGLVLLSLIILGVQWVIVERTKSDIEAMSSQLSGEENISEVLTVQGQLLALPQMHTDKPRTTRLFSYLSTLTPANVGLSTVRVDMELNEIIIEGTAESMRDLNILVDSLKGAKYELGPEVDLSDSQFESLATQRKERFSRMDLSTPERAFSSVVSQISIDAGSSNVAFVITLNFDPSIFDQRYSAVRMSVSDAIDRDSGQTGDAIFDDSLNGEGE